MMALGKVSTWVGGLLLSLSLVACGEEEKAEVTGLRGAPPPPSGAKSGGAKPEAKKSGATANKAGSAKTAADTRDAAVDDDAPVIPPPARPPIALDAKSFQRRRDPFQSATAPEVIVAEPERPKAARPVEMAQYAFEDLKLVTIVQGSGGIAPRALFVASDGHSQAIQQGQYFSSSEVLLAAVNRGYVEIEVVDDNLAGSLNLQRGERRAINLRNE